LRDAGRALPERAAVFLGGMGECVGGGRKGDVAMRSQTWQTMFADLPDLPEWQKTTKTRIFGDYPTKLHNFGTVRTVFISRVRILT